mgnify:CR=1 FL=1
MAESQKQATDAQGRLRIELNFDLGARRLDPLRLFEQRLHVGAVAPDLVEAARALRRLARSDVGLRGAVAAAVRAEDGACC